MITEAILKQAEMTEIEMNASPSEETKTAHKIISRRSTLGETKLIFLVYSEKNIYYFILKVSIF